MASHRDDSDNGRISRIPNSLRDPDLIDDESGDLPKMFRRYDGWLGELLKRAWIRIQGSTLKEGTALYQEATNTYGALTGFRRAKAELRRLPKENEVKDFEFEVRKAKLKREKEEHEQAMKDLADPNRKRRSQRLANPFAADDDDE
jgi:hypothetical protein